MITLKAQDYDEDELERELEDLEQEKLDSELLEVRSGEHELPEVPVSIKEPIGVGQQQKQKGELNKA